LHGLILPRFAESGCGLGKAEKIEVLENERRVCFFIAHPQAQRGFFPAASAEVSTGIEHPHAAFVQCQRSPVFITMAR